MGLSRGVNKAILIGNVGTDPEVKHLDNGLTITKFRLATTETYTKNNERVNNTEWHNIVLFKGQAEVAEKYVKKGDALYIEGRIQTRSWDDQDGNKKYMTEIVGNNMQMLGGGTGKTGEEPAGARQESPQPQEQQSENLGEEDDLPF
jgi:single-strand DNA-binding protein